MQIYDKLLGLPLFQGMSSSDLQEVVTHVKFGFHRYSKNHVIADDNAACSSMIFVIDGSVDVITSSNDHSYNVTEHLRVPGLIQPERIFGLMQRYTSKYVARTQVHCITIQKDDVLLLMDAFVVFRLNFLNILSTIIQRQSRQTWMRRPDETRGRVVRFLTMHCLYPAGEKVFRIKMRQLAEEINESRQDVSDVLNALDAEGLIVLQRGMITIPKLENIY